MKKSTQWIFWAIAAYILFQFLWWALYLVDLNEELLQLKTALAPDENAEQGYLSYFARKKAMIIGEGLVFVSLIAFGIYKVRKNLLEETKNNLQRENFMLSVSHELKSPLAGIQLGLETVLSRDLPKEKQSEVLGMALEETKRLDALTDTILLSARLENVNEKTELQFLDVSAIAKELVSMWPHPKDKNRLQLHQHASLEVMGDGLALKAALRNLIENGLKYSSASETVEIHVAANGSKQIDVIDKGEGIAELERQAIFKRFYRIGNEKTRASKGTGLGLFLVKQVADAMEASISVTSNAPKGSIFTLKF